MRIDTAQSLPPSAPPVVGGSRAGVPVSTESTGSVGPAASYSPTDRLTELLTAMKNTPDVRADVLRSVADRLSAGEFSTPDAAADAAQNLLGSGDLS